MEPPLVPPAVNTLLRGSALNLWQADGTDLKKLNATHKSTLLLGGADGSRWRPPVSRFCGVDATPPEAEPEPVEAPAPAPAPPEEPEDARGPQEPVKGRHIGQVVDKTGRRRGAREIGAGPPDRRGRPIVATGAKGAARRVLGRVSIDRHVGEGVLPLRVRWEETDVG